MENADSRYDQQPWNTAPNEYNSPSGSWEEAALRQATVTITLDRKSVQALVKPSLPSILPPGTKLRHKPAPTLQDVIGEPGSLEDRRAFFSGGPAGYTATSQNSSGWGAP
jgi:hypothetical protein